MNASAQNRAAIAATLRASAVPAKLYPMRAPANYAGGAPGNPSAVGVRERAFVLFTGSNEDKALMAECIGHIIDHCQDIIATMDVSVIPVIDSAAGANNFAAENALTAQVAAFATLSQHVRDNIPKQVMAMMTAAAFFFLKKGNKPVSESDKDVLRRMTVYGGSMVGWSVVQDVVLQLIAAMRAGSVITIIPNHATFSAYENVYKFRATSAEGLSTCSMAANVVARISDNLVWTSFPAAIRVELEAAAVWATDEHLRGSGTIFKTLPQNDQDALRLANAAAAAYEPPAVSVSGMAVLYTIADYLDMKGVSGWVRGKQASDARPNMSARARGAMKNATQRERAAAALAGARTVHAIIAALGGVAITPDDTTTAAAQCEVIFNQAQFTASSVECHLLNGAFDATVTNMANALGWARGW